MSETTWTWLLFLMELIGVYGSYTVGNKKWHGHMIVALHSFPWAVYSIIFDKPGFLAMWVLWQVVHWRNMFKWMKATQMAIGSQGEIGTNFTVWKDMSEEDRRAWFQYMNDNWGEYLQDGYATLVHNKDNRYYRNQ